MANETEIVEVRLPMLPEGYRYTGEYRDAVKGEYINPRGNVIEWISLNETDDPHHIIEKIKWVPCKGDVFYIVTERCTVREVYFLEDVVGEVVQLIEAGNYFKTAELALETAALQRTFLTGRSHE